MKKRKKVSKSKKILKSSKKKSKSKPKSKKRQTSRTKSTKKRPAKKKVKTKANKKSDVDGQLIGRVTHYFPHVNAAVLVVTKGTLKLGDRILIKGHTTNFEESIESLQIDREPISQAKKGDEIGLMVRERVRENDLVYKLN